ncbi:MAG: hypothetical protein AAF962_19555 [Actinomycetota bacterium]
MPLRRRGAAGPAPAGAPAQDNLSPAMSAAAAAARGGVDEDSTMFFPGPNSAAPRTAERPPGRAPARDDDFGPSAFDAPPFDPLDDPKAGDPAAMLAARAEPLGGAGKGAANRTRGTRPAPGGKGGPGAKGTRGAKGARGGTAPAVPRSAATRSAPKSRKPKEPSTLLLGLGLGAVILAGIAAAYFLTRGGDDDQVASDPITVVEEETTDPTDAGEAVTDTDVAGPETTTPPVVEFDAAAVGPIMAGTEYTINVAGGPTDATYQLLVDGVAAAEPAPQLAPVVFAQGRHLVEVKITNATGETSTPPVVVYAAEEAAPGVTFRANLASVNTDPNVEGWAEAVRRFDEFVAAGHTELQLLPSDWYPSLAPGYWNLFVGGFGTRAEAITYCEGFGLSVPDQCFAQEFDPAAPAGG